MTHKISAFPKILSLLLLFFMAREEAFAQFNLWGEIREKVQFRDGYKALKGPEDLGYVINAQRTRLGFTYDFKNMGLVLTLEDSRIWGESENHASEQGLGLAAAYFYVNFCKRFTFEIGRRNVAYDDGRIMAPVGWTDYSTSMDAVLFKYRSLDEKTKVDVGFSLSSNYGGSNFLTAYTVPQMYKYFTWAWLSREFGKKDLIWTLIYANDVNQKENTKNTLYSRSTLGTYFYLFPERQIHALIYGYGQWGRNREGKQVGAYLSSVQLKYNPHPKWELVLAYDFTSGTNYKEADGNFTSRSFDRLMGSSHSFFGYQDYFSLRGTSDVTQGAGIHQPYLRLYFKPHAQHRIELSGRYFSLVYPYVIDPSLPSSDPYYQKYQPMNRCLGGEIDLLYKYDVFEDFSVSLGYSCFIPTSSMERLHGIAPGQSRYSQFAYVMLTYKPQIFNSDQHAQRKQAAATSTMAPKKGYVHRKVEEKEMENMEEPTEGGLAIPEYE